jgi:hypothetical protein
MFRYPRTANEKRKNADPEISHLIRGKRKLLPSSYDDLPISRNSSKSWKDRYRDRYQWEKFRKHSIIHTSGLAFSDKRFEFCGGLLFHFNYSHVSRISVEIRIPGCRIPIDVLSHNPKIHESYCDFRDYVYDLLGKAGEGFIVLVEGSELWI